MIHRLVVGVRLPVRLRLGRDAVQRGAAVVQRGEERLHRRQRAGRIDLRRGAVGGRGLLGQGLPPGGDVVRGRASRKGLVIVRWRPGAARPR
jgi:hypothetical protein